MHLFAVLKHISWLIALFASKIAYWRWVSARFFVCFRLGASYGESDLFLTHSPCSLCMVQEISKCTKFAHCAAAWEGLGGDFRHAHDRIILSNTIIIVNFLFTILSNTIIIIIIFIILSNPMIIDHHVFLIILSNTIVTSYHFNILLQLIVYNVILKKKNVKYNCHSSFSNIMPHPNSAFAQVLPHNP